MRARILPVVLIALASFGCSMGTADKTHSAAVPGQAAVTVSGSGAARTVELWYTGSLNGELEGCDCPELPVPGLVRTAAYIAGRDRARSILVDSGDVFGVKDDPAAYASIARIYAELGYDAVTAGDQDLAGGGRTFLEYIKNIPFRGANVAVCPDAESCVVLGMAPVMLERGGLTVALWSLADPRTYRYTPEPAKAAVRLTGELDAVARAMLDYPGPRDLDILVLHGGEDSARELAAAVPGFDVIVFGHDQVVLDAERVGDTIIASASGNGALVGVMTLRVDESGAVALLDSRARSFDRKRDPQYQMARALADDAIAQRSGSASALAVIGLAVGSRAYATVALVIRIVTALACAALAVLSLIDAARAFGLAHGGDKGNASGDSRRFILQLPEAAKRRAKDLTYAYTKEDESKMPAAVIALGAGALVLGFSTSAFELACTGQVYLPTLAYVARAGKEGALAYLLLYNGAFILPALAVFLASFVGLRSRALGKFMVHYLGYAKLTLALAFAGLAVFIILG